MKWVVFSEFTTDECGMTLFKSVCHVIDMMF